MLDFGALSGIEEEFREIVRGSVFIDAARCDALCRGLRGRIDKLEKVALSQRKRVFEEGIRFDVKKDVAYSGSVDVNGGIR